jgi:hypothetical protein
MKEKVEFHTDQVPAILPEHSGSVLVVKDLKRISDEQLKGLHDVAVARSKKGWTQIRKSWVDVVKALEELIEIREEQAEEERQFCETIKREQAQDRAREAKEKKAAETARILERKQNEELAIRWPDNLNPDDPPVYIPDFAIPQEGTVKEEGVSL